ncbi:FtsQ-type POTRA domain-containing protein [Clostridium sp. MSJ-4]|uniref:FtsQ-type POTRA domain-containing protein n=1 Tax=Clostridium simiarum TaxID=2841506 RepID=A0ABS6EXR9_9CLOT|nr:MULTISPECIES: FtsQ-type POTRA domain-containing protein [Clostridium]MBU5590793.1 FtsQ-type POTRA domain-containing protein [Clostridium simiarum]
MGEIVKSKEDNKLIIKRRRKKAIKKALILFIFLIALLITLCFKLPIFNIKNMIVQGNKVISSEEIIEKSEIKEGNNIFYINTKKIVGNIKNNPYVYSVKISRRLPNTIVFDVKERSAFFYGINNNKYFIIDKESKLLETRSEINNMNLIHIEGLDYQNAEVGKEIFNEDDRKSKIINIFSTLIENNISGIDITSIDIKDVLAIKVYHNNMCIVIGTSDGIEEKLNKAINIILAKPELSQSNGYIDVSFKGNPVVFVQQ